jgi:hypothetical protein
MKLLLLLLSLMLAQAQPTRTVVLTWVDSQAGATYNIYRAPAACGTGTLIFVQIASGITTKTYSDTGVTPGHYCYAATAVVNSSESVQSAPAGAHVRPFAPTGMTVVVQ